MTGHIPNKHEKTLIRKIQQGVASVDIDTGKVIAAWANEVTGENEYLGHLRRKLIPDRRRLLKRKVLELGAEEIRKPTLVDHMLQSGLNLELNKSVDFKEIEDKFNIHPGKPYRVVICGMNPAVTLTFDGVLERAKIYADSKGFTLFEVELRNGFARDYSGRTPFRREVIQRPDIAAFGRILDEKGFYRAWSERRKR